MRFLSDEWRTTALDMLHADETFVRLATPVSLRAWIIAEPCPTWATSVTLVIANGSVDALPGRIGHADGQAVAAYDTWLRLLRNEISPAKAAFLRKLHGKGLPVIMRNMDLFNALIAVLREVPIEDVAPV